MSAADIVTKRIYAPAAADDGHRVLIMRLWPRGIRKERVDAWLKELGPIPTLLREVLDERITWEQYGPRYLAGLERPEAQAAIAEVRRRARDGSRVSGEREIPVWVPGHRPRTQGVRRKGRRRPDAKKPVAPNGVRNRLISFLVTPKGLEPLFSA